MTIHGYVWKDFYRAGVFLAFFFFGFFLPLEIDFILQVLWNYVGTTYDQFMQGADSFEELETELAKQIRKCSNSSKNVCK